MPLQRTPLRQAGARPRGAASSNPGAAVRRSRNSLTEHPESPPAGGAAASTPTCENKDMSEKLTMEGGDGADLPLESATFTCQDRVLRDESNFIQNVSQFYNQQDISDVLLKIGDEKYYAHKFVLAKSSDVFRTMLYNKNFSQAGLPEIVLEESEECQKHFATFLKFLYTAEVNISVDSVVGILCLADKYSVTSLKNLCTQYMVEHTRSPLVSNALSWYSWSKALHMEELIHQCSKTIAWNAEHLLDSGDWHEMEKDFVSDMLKNSDLVIPREHHLFKALIQWLNSEEHKDSYLEYAKELLPLIRFPQMQVHELYEVEQCELFNNEDLKPLLDKLINKAYRFRSLCPQQLDIDVSFSDEFYLPRNYMDLAVDNVRMQNTLRYGIQVDVRTYVGPVPSVARDGEWKITYRKSNDTWTLQLYCHDSALVGGEARVQAALIIADQEDKVIQVEESDITICSRGNHLTMSVAVPNQEVCKSMAVLIKPLPRL